MLWIFTIFIHQQTSDMSQKYKTKFSIIQNKTVDQNPFSQTSKHLNNVICEGKYEACMKGSHLLTKCHESPNSVSARSCFGLWASFGVVYSDWLLLAAILSCRSSVFPTMNHSISANPLPSKCRSVIKMRREHDHLIPANGAFHWGGKRARDALPWFWCCSGSRQSTGTWGSSTGGWWRDPRRTSPWMRRGKPTTCADHCCHRVRLVRMEWSRPSSI